jgi:predicted permease
MNVWQEKTINILKRDLIQFLFIGIFIAIIHITAFMLPIATYLPDIDDGNSFLKVIWQIHASILGISIVVLTIIITVIANDNDRTRTWYLYIRKTKFIHIIWFNLLAILSEGLASLQTYRVINPIFLSDKAGNLIISEGFLLAVSILITAFLFTVTVKFLDEDYVEELAEKRIVHLIPDAVEKDIQRIEEIRSGLKAKKSGH